MVDQTAYNNAYWAAWAAANGQQQQQYFYAGGQQGQYNPQAHIAVSTVAPTAVPYPPTAPSTARGTPRIDSQGNPMPGQEGAPVATVQTTVAMQPGQGQSINFMAMQQPEQGQAMSYMIPYQAAPPASAPAPAPSQAQTTRVSSAPAYVNLPRTYPSPATAAPQYLVSYQYPQSQPRQSQSQLTVGHSATVPAGYVYRTSLSPSPSPSRSSSATQPSAEHVPVVQEKSRQYEYYHYLEKQPSPVPPPAPLPPPAVPVMHCHICVQCGQPRSRKFHHHFPVIPGAPTIQGVCAKCHKKELRKPRGGKVIRRRRSVVHHKSPDIDQTLRIEITSPDRERGRARGRSSSSEERIVVRRARSSSRDDPRGRSHSRTRITLRTSSPSPSPVREVRTRIVHRSVSSSPPREVIKTKTIRESVHRGLDAFRRTPSFPGHRPHSLSPVCEVHKYVEVIEDPRSDAERRIASHPEAFRHGALPDQRMFLRRSPSYSPPPALRQSKPNPRSILRSPSRTRYETPPRRTSARQHDSHRSQESTVDEVGGPRVQFAKDPPRGRSITETSANWWRGRSRERVIERDAAPSPRLQDYNYYQQRPPIPPVPRPTIRSPPPPDPPADLALDLDRVGISDYDNEVFLGPNFRYVSARPPQPPSPLPPQSVKPPWEDGTESGSSETGTVEFVDVKEVWGRDEDGRPSRFVEETRTMRMPERNRDGSSSVRFGESAGGVHLGYREV